MKAVIGLILLVLFMFAVLGFIAGWFTKSGAVKIPGNLKTWPLLKLFLGSMGLAVIVLIYMGIYRLALDMFPGGL